MESTMAGNDIELLNVQHEKTQQMVNILEEKFANILDKFDTMRSENEMQQVKLMNEQKKLINEQKQTRKLAFVAAKKVVAAQPVEQANDYLNGKPQQQTQPSPPERIASLEG